MDFGLTQEQAQLKAEFEAFFEEEAKRAPEGWMGSAEEVYVTDEAWAYHRSIAEKLAAKGWVSLAWPKEYGGQEHSYIEQLLFQEVKGYYRCPGVDMHSQGISASILYHGSEEMKKKWLPRIARAEISWAEGYSEPNAGSDLASLTTVAVEDGDDYVINGQKTWTTGAQRCDHVFLLARTDRDAVPKYRGLTFFISELNKPGVTIRPIHYMTGDHVYNEIFFDNFRIPKTQIVGELNKGWYVTMAGRNFARVRVEMIGGARRSLEDLIQFCCETRIGGKVLAKDPIVRQKVAELAIELEAGRLSAYHVASLQSKGVDPASEASAAKYFNTELLVRLANTGLEIMGLYGMVTEGSKWAPLKGYFAHMSQFDLGLTIGGGTTDVQHNIIAWRALNLPRN